ncbi:hypothetical protein C8Q79DRAFT_1001147 [Trametes meyenii]|nr:hypothetical protein C8Q79DRAFT_1001147 [Trametes meyenii]
MKAAFVALALVASAFAQNAIIAQPADGSSAAKGSSIDVVVQKQNSLTGSQEVAIAIGLEACTTGDCSTLPDQDVGRVLFHGEYAPTADAAGNVTQTFSVQVPTDLAAGPARLSVAHFAIVGASNAASLDVAHSTINVTD